MKRLVLFVLILSLVALPAFAWGEKGHYIVNEAATFGVPADMPAFFHQAYPELIYLAYDPDRWRGGGGESLDAFSAPNHFLDYEFVAGLKLPPKRYDYLDLMYTSGRLRQRGITNDEAGFVPWQVAEMTELLTIQFRLWRNSAPGSPQRDYIERNVIHVAGILGHFVGDSANPHHATINYNGWIEPNPNGYPNDCGTHSRFESNFVSHALDTKDVTPKLAAPVLRSDYFATALAFLRESNALTERIYQLDRDGAFDPIRRPSAEGVDFAASRLAAGASMLRDLWWSAWRNSGQRPARER